MDELQKYVNSKTNNIDFSILNPTNVLITKEYIESITGHMHIFDINNFIIAMTHDTYIIKNFDTDFKSIFNSIENYDKTTLKIITDKPYAIPLQEHTYDRLEIYGDALLKSVLTEYIFLRYSTMNSDEITTLRSKLENRIYLTQVTKSLGLEKYLLIGKLQEEHSIRNNSGKILCDILESFIGALFFDSLQMSVLTNVATFNIERNYAYGICYSFIVNNIIEVPFSNICELILEKTNYKDILKKYYKKHFDCDPIYKLLQSNTSFMSSKSVLMIGMQDIHGKILFTESSTKKTCAEQALSKKMLEYLGENTSMYKNNEDINI